MTRAVFDASCLRQDAGSWKRDAERLRSTATSHAEQAGVLLLLASAEHNLRLAAEQARRAAQILDPVETR